MGRTGLTNEQTQALDAAFQQTGNASAAARAVGVSPDQAARYFAKQRKAGVIIQRGPTLAEQLSELDRDLSQIIRKLRRLKESS